MSGNRSGVMKTAALRVGVSTEEYAAKVAAGEKWCTACRAWHPLDAFPVDRSRGDGRRAGCLTSQHGKPRSTYDPLKDKARYEVTVAIRYGRLAHPNSVPCMDCDHRWADGERRHEYDHHNGYDEAHWLDVQPVCTTCHADRERRRRVGTDLN